MSGLVSSLPVATFVYRQQRQWFECFNPYFNGFFAQLQDGFMYQPQAPGKLWLSLTAADGLRVSYIARMRFNTPHPKGMNDGNEIAFTACQLKRAFLGNGLVVDPA